MKKMYSVYDNKAKSYGPVFSVAHDAVAIREFGSACQAESSPFSKYPDDFELHVIGAIYEGDEIENTPFVGWLPVTIITARSYLSAIEVNNA